MGKTLVGVDVGTTGLKVAFFRENGEVIDRAYREYRLSFPRSGWAEIAPEIWWESLCGCFGEIWRRGRAAAEDVAGLGITCTNALILLDKDGRPVAPAVMQLDQRAAACADRIRSDLGEERVFAKTGNRVSCGAFWGPTFQWFRENRPSVCRRARYLLCPTGYLVLKLTGVYSIDHSRAASTMFYHIHKKKWDPELCRYFGLPAGILPPIFKSCDVVGRVHSAGESATGLKAGTPVVAGAMDSIGALIGLGVGREKGALILGSVGRICMESEKLDMRFMNTVNFDASGTLLMTPVNSTGVSYRWIRDILFPGDGRTDLFRAMDRMAEKVPVGSGGLLYLPYLSGERSPIWDPHARGGFLGLTVDHRREHLLRSVLEGVGFALAENFEILKNDLKVDPPFLVVGGGGAKSEVWVQIISNIFGKVFQIPAEKETETMGGAILAGLGTGAFPDLESIRDTWNRVVKVVTPQNGAVEKYQKLLAVFKKLYPENRFIFEKLYQNQF